MQPRISIPLHDWLPPPSSPGTPSQPARKENRIGWLLAILLLLWIPATLDAAIPVEKTPSDVFREAQKLADDVRKLRQHNGITTPWPQIAPEEGREPRHVFQKALEILEKINRYRTNIAGIGEIAIPRFPGRDITPNEVYSVVVRLRQELRLLVDDTASGLPVEIDTAPRDPRFKMLKTPSDVYAILSEISLALEQTLGLRSITPSEVYTRSQRVINLVRFLRRSQNLPMEVPPPERTSGRLPNHALTSVLQLQEKIRLAEHNLWMPPLTVQKQPRRVITPSDVYDAMGVVIAELQRIQFRLGLERSFPDPEPESGKTPDDVIYNTRWATRLMPEFSLTKPLLQYDRSVLRKTPSHVYSVATYILDRLTRYRRLRGIQTPPRKAHMIRGLKPRHVYGKALEILEKINVLRQQQGLGAMSVPRYPLRTITPAEVYDLTLRLDEELAIVHRQLEPRIELWSTAPEVKEFEDKQPSDVFLKMQKISNLLDTLIGVEGFTPNDVFREVLTIKQEVQIIAHHLGEPIPEETWDEPVLRPATEPRHVLAQAKKVLDLIVQAKRRAGMFGEQKIMISPEGQITPTDVYNQVRLIESELTQFKVFLGINQVPNRPPPQEGKAPADVLRVLEGVTAALETLLQHDHREDG